MAKCSQDLINQKVNEKLKSMQSSTADIQRQNQITAAMREAGLPLNNINGLVAMMRDRLTCDDDCLRERKRKELKIGLSGAKRNLREAPKKVEVAEKDYVTFVKGKKGYDEMLFKRYAKEAATLKAEALDKHSDLMEELHALNKDYDAETQFAFRMSELLKIRARENKELKRVIDDEIAATETNDRRVVYEDKERDWLHTVRKGEILLYFLGIVVYLILGDFFSAARYKSIRDVSLLAAAILLPFLISRISRLIFSISDTVSYILQNKAPKNVYV